MSETIAAKPKRRALPLPWRRIPAKKSLKPHPLEPIARAAFAEEAQQDVLRLAFFMTDGAIVKPGFNAYRTVAEDVLGYMEAQGLLTQDRMGWYTLVVSAPAAEKELSL